ncbi:unnamed protein product [Malus baccata var. baccata]
MDNITASELAGFGVGTLLLCATIAAPKSTLSSPPLSAACSRCKGIGLIKEGEMLGSNLIDDMYESLGGEGSKVRSISCTKCQARGHFSCPDCSKPTSV